jgi:hypothetical protein
LTPVYFRRERLAKYFAEPERYKYRTAIYFASVFGHAKIDNDFDNHVAVFRGDLASLAAVQCPAGKWCERSFCRSRGVTRI